MPSSRSRFRSPLVPLLRFSDCTGPRRADRRRTCSPWLRRKRGREARGEEGREGRQEFAGRLVAPRRTCLRSPNCATASSRRVCLQSWPLLGPFGRLMADFLRYSYYTPEGGEQYVGVMSGIVSDRMSGLCRYFVGSMSGVRRDYVGIASGLCRGYVGFQPPLCRVRVQAKEA